MRHIAFPHNFKIPFLGLIYKIIEEEPLVLQFSHVFLHNSYYVRSSNFKDPYVE